MFKNIQADIRRHIVILNESPTEKITLTNFMRVLIYYFGLHCILVYRLGQFAKKQIQPFRIILMGLYYILEFLTRLFYDVRLSLDSEIGPGFFIHHVSGIRIKKCHIGKNVTIHQRVSVNLNGDNNTRISDNVWIGPQCQIEGGVIIGSNAAISAGSNVTINVPENSLVAGNPARILKMGFDNSILQKANNQ